MTKPALNPVSPSHAQACNAPSRSLVLKQHQNRLALVSEQILPGFTSHHFVTPAYRSALPNIPSERNRPIQIP
jgi:hypothetical protein